MKGLNFLTPKTLILVVARLPQKSHFLGLKCIFLCRRAPEPGNISADLVDDSSGYDGASDKGRDQVKPVTGNVVSWREGASWGSAFLTAGFAKQHYNYFEANASPQ